MQASKQKITKYAMQIIPNGVFNTNYAPQTLIVSHPPLMQSICSITGASTLHYTDSSFIAISCSDSRYLLTISKFLSPN